MTEPISEERLAEIVAWDDWLVKRNGEKYSIARELQQLRAALKECAMALEAYLSQGFADYEHECLSFDFVLADELQTQARAALASARKLGA